MVHAIDLGAMIKGRVTSYILSLYSRWPLLSCAPFSRRGSPVSRLLGRSACGEEGFETKKRARESNEVNVQVPPGRTMLQGRCSGALPWESMLPG